MTTPIEDRVEALEEQVAKVREQAGGAKKKDNWDKLSALSTLLSGVIIASIGIWVNETLTTSQQHAQQAQEKDTRDMEKAHNDAADRQASQSLQLQSAQAANLLAFQKQQAADQRALEKLRMEQQDRQAANSLTQQREHDDATLKLQQTQLAKDFIPQLEGTSRTRATALQLMETVNPSEALILSEQYSETSSDASLQKTSATVIQRLQNSTDPELSRQAAAVEVRVTWSKRIQAIENVNFSGNETRDYGRTNWSGQKSGNAPATYESYLGALRFHGDQLRSILDKYCAAKGARYGSAVKPYIARFAEADPKLESDGPFEEIMKEAGSDPVMQEIQDEAFETGYWRPMQEEARKLGLKMPLTIAMVYHQAVHMGISSAQTMAEEASASAGGTPAQGIDEHDWAKAFLLLRLRLTDRVQMQGAHGEFFGEMIEKGNWNLDPPLIVNGVTIAD